MEVNVLWSGVLSVLVGFMVWSLRNLTNQLQRQQIQLNKTREGIAKEYVTKVEMQVSVNQILDRLEHLDQKLDRLMERTHAG